MNTDPSQQTRRKFLRRGALFLAAGYSAPFFLRRTALALDSVASDAATKSTGGKEATKPVRACLLVSDAPISATYWMRIQQLARGYQPNETGGWGVRWREEASAAFFRVSDLHAFADIVEEYGIRGKFTLLARPAGLGRLDQKVRGISDADLAEFLDLIRKRIAPRFNITPEVLTHTFAIEAETGAMLPHMEVPWLKHLIASGQLEALRAYLRHAWTILHKVGVQAHGLWLGSMADVSGIAQGTTANSGQYRQAFAEALLSVESEFNPKTLRSFMNGGITSKAERDKTLNYPQVIAKTNEGASAYAVYALDGDPCLSLLYGDGDLAKATDALVAPDLASGQWIEAAEQGCAVVIGTHVQTLNARNTGMGLQLLRESVRRLKERYGQRLVWYTADELCQQVVNH